MKKTERRKKRWLKRLFERLEKTTPCSPYDQNDQAALCAKINGTRHKA